MASSQNVPFANFSNEVGVSYPTNPDQETPKQTQEVKVSFKVQTVLIMFIICEVCEHCQSPVSKDDKVTIHEGFSYHKKCHKCYVCSETNLQNAEVFKGVIFCSGCAQRIFQGCSTARRTKPTHTGRVRRTRSKSHRRDRERVRAQEMKTNRSRDGVIELARLAGSNTTDSEDHMDKKQKILGKPAISKETMQDERKGREENCFYLQPVVQMKRDSTEMGTTTDVTQELLRQINCHVPEGRAKPCGQGQTVSQSRQHHRKKEIYEPVRNKPICSDLRIAELGVSTEIANMALRKNSEVPVVIKSASRLKGGRTSYSLSVLCQESDISGDRTDWMDSAYSSITSESETMNMMDRRLGSILKLPLKFFKKNILNRSSLISVLMSTEDHQNISLIRRLKQMLYEEITEHQVRGIKRLYSTINRRKTPYKLGWLDLIAKVSNIVRDQDFCTCSSAYKKRCRHFKDSHSYRCMRAQVMKLAGPTISELAFYRRKIKRFIAPKFLRNILSHSKDYPAIKLSQACGRSCNGK